MVEHGVEELPILAPGMTRDRVTLDVHLQLIRAGVAKVMRHTGRKDRLLASHGAPATAAEAKPGCSGNDGAMLGQGWVDVIQRAGLSRREPEVGANHTII
jgi:hypothetical protein